MFYRAVARPGKPAVFVPPPDEHFLHLSQARGAPAPAARCRIPDRPNAHDHTPTRPHAHGPTRAQAALAHDVPEGTRASLLVRFDPEEEPALLCTLTAGRLDTVALDQFLAHYAEFTVAGGAAIHLSGFAAAPAPAPRRSGGRRAARHGASFAG